MQPPNHSLELHEISFILMKFKPSQNQPQKSKQTMFQHITINASHLYNVSITSAHGILLCPTASSGFIFGSVSLVHMGNLWYKRVIRIWISQQWANGEQYLISIHQLAEIINKSFFDCGSMGVKYRDFCVSFKMKSKASCSPNQPTEPFCFDSIDRLKKKKKKKSPVWISVTESLMFLIYGTCSQLMFYILRNINCRRTFKLLNRRTRHAPLLSTHTSIDWQANFTAVTLHLVISE